MRRDEPIKSIPRHLLQNLVKDAIVMLHGIAPLVSGSSPNVPNRVESMPCALSTKTQPDSRGFVPGIHVDGRNKPTAVRFRFSSSESSNFPPSPLQNSP